MFGFFGSDIATTFAERREVENLNIEIFTLCLFIFNVISLPAPQPPIYNSDVECRS